MEQLLSPELPAYLCYLIVLVLGILVARSYVNGLLADQPGRWRFANTWAVFWAYAFIPVALFWFLDYTSAVRDTSAFAALLVAFGYRQIFAGGIKGVAVSGQVSRLWRPFETWVARISNAITTQDRRERARFDEIVRTHLASDPERLRGLTDTAFVYTRNPAKLVQDLTGVTNQNPPPGTPAGAFATWQNRERVRILLGDLRTSQPEDYDSFLLQAGLITEELYLGWGGRWRSKVIGWVITALVAGTLLLGGWQAWKNERIQLWYFQWRFAKSNVSDLDRFWSSEYLTRRLRTLAAKPANSEPIPRVLEPLLTPLRFSGNSPQAAENILRLVVDVHAPAVNAVVIPQLIEGLRTQNADIRLRIQRTLVEIQEADYKDSMPANAALIAWVPKKEESAADIDRFVQAWQAWWATVKPQ